MNLSKPSYTLVVSAEAAALVFNALMELPAKTSRALLNDIERQLALQERGGDDKAAVAQADAG